MQFVYIFVCTNHLYKHKKRVRFFVRVSDTFFVYAKETTYMQTDQFSLKTM